MILSLKAQLYLSHYLFEKIQCASGNNQGNLETYLHVLMAYFLLHFISAVKFSKPLFLYLFQTLSKGSSYHSQLSAFSLATPAFYKTSVLILNP